MTRREEYRQPTFAGSFDAASHCMRHDSSEVEDLIKPRVLTSEDRDQVALKHEVLVDGFSMSMTSNERGDKAPRRYRFLPKGR